MGSGAVPTFLRTQACPLRLEPEPGLCLPALLVQVEGISPGCLGAGSCPRLPDLLGVAQARSRGPGSRWEAPTGGRKHDLASPSSPGPTGHLSPRLPRPVLHRPPPSLPREDAASHGTHSRFKSSQDLGAESSGCPPSDFSARCATKIPPRGGPLGTLCPAFFQKGKGPPLPCRSGGILSDVSLKCSDRLDISSAYCGCTRNPSHRFFRAQAVNVRNVAANPLISMQDSCHG